MKFRVIFLLVVAIGIAPAFADIAADLTDQFRIFLIKPERSSPGDRITINGDTAVITYWESLKNQKTEDVICNAFSWLLLGRTTYGRGVKEAFDKFPSIQQVDLSFYEIDFGTKKGTRRAEILPSQSVFEYLKIGIKRDSFAKKSFNRKDVEKMIEDRKCADVGKEYIDTVAINEAYLKSRK